jgi:protein-tyrosine phosphatase
LGRINLFLPDLFEMKAKKSEIFSLSFQTNQVKRDLSFPRKIRDDSYPRPSLRRQATSSICYTVSKGIVLFMFSTGDVSVHSQKDFTDGAPLSSESRQSQPPRRATPAKRPPIPLSWVQVGSGRLSLWGRPGSKSFPFLREAGCTRVVTLLSEKEGAAAIGEQATKAQLAWTWIPLPGRTPPSGEARAQVLERLTQLSAYLDQGESLLIHCSAGIHRTGMVTYALLRRRGLSGAEAREVLTRLRQHTAEGMHPEHYAWGDAAL